MSYPAAALAAAAVAAAASVASTAVSYSAAKTNADNQAAWYDYNAQVAKQQAQMAKTQADAEAGRKSDEWDTFISRQRALEGATGMAMGGEGSSLVAVLGKTAQQKAFDVDTIKWKGNNALLAGQTQANLQGLQGQNAASAYGFKANQDLLSGLSTLANMGGKFASPSGSGGGSEGGMTASVTSVGSGPGPRVLRRTLPTTSSF